MKKLILMSLSLVFIMTACYEEYKVDYDYTATYFAYQFPARTVYIDRESETMDIQIGAVMGGRYSYDDSNEYVKFSIEDTLITNNESYLDAGIKVMPKEWYTLSDESKILMEGSNAGTVTVSINRDLFIANADASKNTYAIPFLMTESSCDSILSGKEYSIVVVKYKNENDGRYYVKGADNALNADGTVASTEVYTNDALVLNKYVFLNTIDQDKVEISRIGNLEEESKYKYDMQIRSTDGASVLSLSESTTAVSSLVGASSYNQEEKTFISNYNYMVDGVEHSVVDTLIFYNRHDVREEWR